MKSTLPIAIAIGALTVVLSCVAVRPAPDDAEFVDDPMPVASQPAPPPAPALGGPPRWGPLEPGTHLITIRIIAQTNELGRLMTLSVRPPPVMEGIMLGLNTWLCENYTMEPPVTCDVGAPLAAPGQDQGDQQ